MISDSEDYKTAKWRIKLKIIILSSIELTFFDGKLLSHFGDLYRWIDSYLGLSRHCLYACFQLLTRTQQPDNRKRVIRLVWSSNIKPGQSYISRTVICRLRDDNSVDWQTHRSALECDEVGITTVTKSKTWRSHAGLISTGLARTRSPCQTTDNMPVATYGSVSCQIQITRRTSDRTHVGPTRRCFLPVPSWTDRPLQAFSTPRCRTWRDSPKRRSSRTVSGDRKSARSAGTRSSPLLLSAYVQWDANETWHARASAAAADVTSSYVTTEQYDVYDDKASRSTSPYQLNQLYVPPAATPWSSFYYIFHL